MTSKEIFAIIQNNKEIMKTQIYLFYIIFHYPILKELKFFQFNIEPFDNLKFNTILFA